jgi:2-keto-4-pentenoate hydratase
MESPARDAAALLLGVEQDGRLLDRLPEACRPGSVADAYAIQDLVIGALGPIGGWKVGMGSPDAEPSCAPVPASRILASGAAFDPARHPGFALEIEFAFRLRRDLPARSTQYGYDEIAASVDFVPLIELIGGRFRDRGALSAFEQLADANGNDAFIVGTPVEAWRGTDFRARRVELAIDGRVVQSALGTHPAGDPLLLVVWQANHAATRSAGLKRGDVVTTGSLQGATPIAAGRHAAGDWGPLGRVEVFFQLASR